MKSLSILETQAISGGLRSAHMSNVERNFRRREPMDPIVPVDASTDASTETTGPARSIDASTGSSGNFASPIPLAGFIAPTWMTGEPIRTFPIVDAPITIVDAPDDSATNTQADTSVSPSNADSFGGGGDAGAAGGCSAGDGGSCGGW